MNANHTTSEQAAALSLAHFNYRLMQAVARRIVRMAQTNIIAARLDYQQHVSAMTETEKREFDALIASEAVNHER